MDTADTDTDNVNAADDDGEFSLKFLIQSTQYIKRCLLGFWGFGVLGFWVSLQKHRKISLSTACVL